MNIKIYLVATTVLFAVIGVIHLIRFLLGWSVQLGTWTVPLSASLIAVVACGVLSLWGSMLAFRGSR